MSVDIDFANLSIKDALDLAAELRQEEVEHMEMVREQMKNIPVADGFDPGDFADEPIAQ